MIDRNLRSPAQREEAYAQARNAMVRRLWSFDPPLSEDEIDARIGLFDVAVDRIEADLLATFTEEPEPEPPPPPPRAPPPRPAPIRRAAQVRPAPPPPVAELPDEEHYAPALDPEPPPMAEEEAVPIPAPASRASSAANARAARAEMEQRRLVIEAALRGEPVPEAPAAEEVDEEIPETAEPEIAFALYEEQEPEPAPVPASRRRETTKAVQPARRPPVQYEDEDTHTASQPARSPRAPIRGRAVPVLIAAIVCLALVIIGLGAYLIAPMLVGTHADEVRPVAKGAAGQPADDRSIALFDGTDPTVFEASADNPIRFSGDANGGFARVSTSASAPGVRAVIGPGLATRLAGRNIRVTMMVRSASESGAATLRFAYQSGLAISHWQSATLRPEFAPVSLAWRVPAMRTSPDNDYLLIEPGVPGDGTAADIESIRIEVVA